ncbi:MAG: ribulokinase [Calditrichia bacterium]
MNRSARSENKYSLGIDFGTNSVRALIIDLSDGSEIATAVAAYPSGEMGILQDPANPHLARQHPGDYLASMQSAVSQAVKTAENNSLSVSQIAGIGVDGTGSTPLPVDQNMRALGLYPQFKNNLNAQAWLWKDHSSNEEAAQITRVAAEIRPQYLQKCGGAYSSEWFFSKIFHCLKTDPEVFAAADSWIELSDYIPALLCGIHDVRHAKRNICAAGHKAMYNSEWGGLPDEAFLARLAPEMGTLRNRLYERAVSSDQIAGYLSAEWAEKFGLPVGLPVAVGALDAHFGAVGAGIAEGTLVKIIGTSTCDIMVYPADGTLKDIPGVAGIVNGSVLPGYLGIEAGQSAVGDIFHWFVSRVLQGGEEMHIELSRQATELNAGQSGLLALDWNNGNRNILADHDLSGLLVGQTLHTSAAEIYRTLIEATAFGALRIIENIEECGVKIDQIINCGGIAEKNPLVMQIYADVMNRPMKVAESAQTVALGAAIFGGAAALKAHPEFDSVPKIQQRVCRVKEQVFFPTPAEHNIYKKLYDLYKSLHDAFGRTGSSTGLFPIMKELLNIKRESNTRAPKFI